jgi:hypothetical protein
MRVIGSEDQHEPRVTDLIDQADVYSDYCDSDHDCVCCICDEPYFGKGAVCSLHKRDSS